LKVAADGNSPPALVPPLSITPSPQTPLPSPVPVLALSMSIPAAHQNIRSTILEDVRSATRRIDDEMEEIRRRPQIGGN